MQLAYYFFNLTQHAKEWSMTFSLWASPWVFALLDLSMHFNQRRIRFFFLCFSYNTANCSSVVIFSCLPFIPWPGSTQPNWVSQPSVYSENWSHSFALRSSTDVYLSISRSLIISSPPALLGLIIFRENEAGKLVDKVPPSSDGKIYKKRKFWLSLYNQKWIFNFQRMMH